MLGSLSDQITYPDAEGTVTEGELKELLERVDLGLLLLDSGAAADARVNWEDKLSLGEQQRLAMARLFYHRPKFAILVRAVLLFQLTSSSASYVDWWLLAVGCWLLAVGC